MKRKTLGFALLAALFLTVFSVQTSYAQPCAFLTQPQMVNGTTPTGVTSNPYLYTDANGNCMADYYEKLTFTIEYSNNGQKQIYAHFWGNDVPSTFGNSAPTATNLLNTANNYLGTLVFLVNDDKSLTVENTYWPDNNISVMTLPTTTITGTQPQPTTEPAMWQYTIDGIKFTVPCGYGHDFEVGLWSTNATQGTSPHCYTAQGTNNLPVKYGALKATNSNGRLLVDWQALTENNVKEYVVEASKDGKSWTEIGRIASKAADGNSDTTINYQLAVGLPVSLAAISFALMLLVPAFRSRNARLIAILAIIGTIAACSKNAKEVNSADKDQLFVRIAQFDKDATTPRYSKIIKVTNE